MQQEEGGTGRVSGTEAGRGTILQLPDRLGKKGCIIMLLGSKVNYMLHIHSQNYESTEYRFNRYLRENFIEKMVGEKERI